MAVEEGKKAPAFTLKDQDGKPVSLKDFTGKKVVLYFYPRDNTPGCTREAQGFQAALAKIKRKGAVVLGVSKDTAASHCKFRDKHGLTFPLLTDPDTLMMQKYGVWQEKTLYGKKSMGVVRTTVIIDETGKVKKIFPKVKVDGHVEKVMEEL